MKKLEELNLKDAEVLDRSAFMSYFYNNSGTGTSGSSGSSGTSGSSGITNPLLDKCKKDSDCPSGEVCDDTGIGILSYKKCRKKSVIENACAGKSIGSDCNWDWEEQNHKGKCVHAMGAKLPHCSDSWWWYEHQ